MVWAVGIYRRPMDWNETTPPPIGRAETIGRNDEEPGIYIAGKAYLGGGGTMPGYGVQFPILLLSAHRRRHLKAHFYSEHQEGGQRSVHAYGETRE